mmetsp:Transcript_16247/g.30367  ORF Transcript_16247/g.30367 Transcript_16247/m.30367 type:complete len:273 (+) Transcript_16247:134-952(+)
MHAKNASHGVFTSASAVRSKSRDEVNRLYFSTTANVEHSHKQLMQDERAESLGHIHYIGTKATKYLPFQYKQAPNVNKSACWYAHDYCEKPSDAEENRALAQTFQYRKPIQKSKLFATKSHYSHTFPILTPSEIRSAKLPSQDPRRFGERKTIGGDANVHTQSFSHHMHRAPPKDVKAAGEFQVPVHNLELPSKIADTDQSDMLRSMYATDFKGQQKKASRGKDRQQGRTSSAPSLVSGATSSVGDEASGVSAKTDSNVYKVRRAPFMAPGQ